MSRVRYELTGGLNPRQIERIHEQAIAVVGKLGIDVPHEKTLKLLAGTKGVAIKGTRVRFADWLVNESTLSAPREPDAERPFEIHAGVYCLNLLDLDGNARQPTSADVVQMARLADALDMKGETPLEPTDLPPRLRQVFMVKACWENSRALTGGYLYDLEAAEYVYEMAQAAGRPFCLGGTAIISPLKIDPAKLELFHHFLDRGVPVGMGNMPMPGVSAPIFYPGAFVQGMAEVLGAVTLTRLIFAGSKGRGVVHVYPYDMKYNTVAFGSPEKLHLMLIGMQIARYFGANPFPDALMCLAKQPDAQASAEKLAQVLIATAAGARAFRYAGTLAQDDLFSPEQLVIDREIVNYAAHFAKGFETGPEEGYLKIIEDGINEGGFLAHETTLENFRDVCWFPELFERDSLAQWRQKGEQSVRRRAAQIAREKIAEHAFALPADVRKELNAIYGKARDKLS